MTTPLSFTVTDTTTGFEIHVDPHVVAEALHKVGWTVFPPRTAEEVMAMADEYAVLGDRVEGWQGYTERSWQGADKSHTLVPEPVTDRPGRSRRGDHATSVQGARDVAFRAGTQLHRLLAEYALAVNDGLTDEQAAERAALLHSCYWKRCGELRVDGLTEIIFDNCQPVTRLGSAGTPRIVCVITDAGIARLDALAAVR